METEKVTLKGLKEGRLFRKEGGTSKNIYKVHKTKSGQIYLMSAYGEWDAKRGNFTYELNIGSMSEIVMKCFTFILGKFFKIQLKYSDLYYVSLEPQAKTPVKAEATDNLSKNINQMVIGSINLPLPNSGE